MWAVAIHDYQLTEEQFGRLTLPQFWLLWERRKIAFKRNCYLQGIVAAAVYNSQRSEANQHVFKPREFVAMTPSEAEREELIEELLGQYAVIPPEKRDQARAIWLENLTKAGRTDAEEILEEVFSE